MFIAKFIMLALVTINPNLDLDTLQINFAIAFPESPLPVADQAGLATTFGTPGDKWTGGNLGCDATRAIQPGDQFCAHRNLPCGATLIVENIRTHARTTCIVMDRGPYGAYVYDDSGSKTWVVKIKPTDPGTWRGILDMSPKVSNDIGHNGFEPVRIWEYNRLKKNYRKFINRRNSI